MQIAAETTTSPSLRGAAIPDSSAISTHSHSPQYKVLRRSGAVVGFGPSRIPLAVTKALPGVTAEQGAASAWIRELIWAPTRNVLGAHVWWSPTRGTSHIEDVKVQVERESMRLGEQDVAWSYVPYRGKSALARAQETVQMKGGGSSRLPRAGAGLLAGPVEDSGRRSLLRRLDGLCLYGRV
jgi:ribonucleoside-diphosphate reductase alpha chain